MRTKAFVLAIFCVFICLFISWLLERGVSLGWLELSVALTLSGASLLSRFFPVEFGIGEVEISDMAMLTALILLGPVWALLVILPVVVYRDKLRTAFAFSCDSVTILGAGFAFYVFSEPLSHSAGFDSRFIYGTVMAGITFYGLDALINACLVRVKYGDSAIKTMREFFIPKVPSDVLAVLAALGTAYVLVAFGPAAALVLFPGAAGALISLNLIHTRQKENEALKLENADLLAQNVRFVAAVVGAVGSKEPGMVRLANASSVYAGDVGAEFGFYREHLDRLRIAALLQDVGFAGIPDAVMKAAPKRLNAAGRVEFERHPVIGEEILAQIPGFEEPAKWVRWHHERMDGSGFPDALKSQWIPLEARILAATSAYASLVCDTKESPAITPKEARLALTAEVNGTVATLDSEVVKALLRVLDREGASYAAAAGERFSEAADVEVAKGSVRLRVVGSGG